MKGRKYVEGNRKLVKVAEEEGKEGDVYIDLFTKGEVTQKDKWMESRI